MLAESTRVAGIYNSVEKLVSKCGCAERLHDLRDELWPALFSSRTSFGSDPDAREFPTAGFMSTLMAGSFEKWLDPPKDDVDIFGPAPVEENVSPKLDHILHRADPRDAVDFSPSIADYIQVVTVCEEVRYHTGRYDDEIEVRFKPLTKVVARILGECFSALKVMGGNVLTPSWALFNLLQSAYDYIHLQNPEVRGLVQEFDLHHEFSIANYGSKEAVVDWRKWQFEKIPSLEAMQIVIRAGGSRFSRRTMDVVRAERFLKDLKYKPLAPVVKMLKAEAAKKRVDVRGSSTRHCWVTGKAKRVKNGEI